LVGVDAALADVVAVSPFIDPPPWGLAPDLAASRSMVWLGQGDAEGLGGVFSARTPKTVELICDAMPGPSLPTPSRTVELQLTNRAGEQSQRQVFNGSDWRFRLMLEPGANHFRLRVLDEATVAIQPNGDTRRLLSLLHQITVRPVSD